MSRWQIGGLSAALVMYLAGLAHAEMYVGGQIGYAMPSALTGVSGEGARSGLTTSDIDLQNSVAFGAKKYFSASQVAETNSFRKRARAACSSFICHSSKHCPKTVAKQQSNDGHQYKTLELYQNHDPLGIHAL